MQTNESTTFSEGWFHKQTNYEVLRIADSGAHLEGVNLAEQNARSLALIKTLANRLVYMSPDLKKAREVGDAN